MLKDSAIFDRYGYRVVILKNSDKGGYKISIYRKGNVRAIELSSTTFTQAYATANEWLTNNRSIN